MTFILMWITTFKNGMLTPLANHFPSSGNLLTLFSSSISNRCLHPAPNPSKLPRTSRPMDIRFHIFRIGRTMSLLHPRIFMDVRPHTTLKAINTSSPPTIRSQHPLCRNPHSLRTPRCLCGFPSPYTKSAKPKTNCKYRHGYPTV